MTKRKKGFTLIELITVIACIGILVVSAFPLFIDISSESEESSEDDIVGGVKTGLQLYYSQSLVDTGRGSYPETLDDATAGESSTGNPFFTDVLQDPYRGDDWQKVDDETYTGPAGGIYLYDNIDGTFLKQN